VVKYKAITNDRNYDASCTLTSLPVWDLENFKRLVFVVQSVPTLSRSLLLLFSRILLPSYPCSSFLRVVCHGPVTLFGDCVIVSSVSFTVTFSGSSPSSIIISVSFTSRHLFLCISLSVFVSSLSFVGVYCRSRGSSVSIVSDYGLDGPVFDPRQW
jgi:hypothetical protein